MALTRKYLSALGIESDKVDEIINAHSETVDALKEQRDEFKAEAERLKPYEEKYQKLKESVDDTLPEKYESLQKEYDEYKEKVKTNETTRAKTTAYKGLLEQVGIKGKRADKIMQVTSLDSFSLDKDGNIKDAEKISDSIKEEWADFIPTVDKKGAETDTPPANKGGGTKTKEEIMAIKDTEARQQAIAENHELFGF